MERAWIKAGHSPAEFWGASLRQCFAVIRATRDRQKEEWEHTLTIVAKIHNSTAKKRGDLVDPANMIEKMFGRETQPVERVKDNLIDKFRMLALQTGGRDYRKSKPS